MDVTLPAAYAVGNAAARCAFAFVTARKTARCKQERPDDERNPEAVPVREGIVWMREGDDGALCLWPPLRVQELLPVRRRLRLQRHEAGGREQGEGETLAPPLSPWRSGSRRAVGVILHRDTIDVDATERQRVLGLQSLEEARDAAADGVPLVEVGPCFLVELAGERRKRAIARAAPPIVIDDGIAQHTVEPRHRGLRTLEGHLLQATREGF